MTHWEVSAVTVQELWGSEEISLACAGSKRAMIAALGGWGNVKGDQQDQFVVEWPDVVDGTLSVRRISKQ